jgi:putative spermidine/putrescine transport system substrate-binding protein
VRLILTHHGITGFSGGEAMRKWSTIFMVAALTAIVPRAPAQAADVICYNCPPQWADFASMLKAIKADLGYDIPFDNKNSGQASAMS